MFAKFFHRGKKQKDSGDDDGDKRKRKNDGDKKGTDSSPYSPDGPSEASSSPEELSHQAVLKSLQAKARQDQTAPSFRNSSAWIEMVPRELLREILSQLDLGTLLTCRQVCHNWERLCFKASPELDIPNECDDMQLVILMAAFPMARHLKLPKLFNFSKNGWLLLSELHPQPKLDFSAVEDSILLNNYQVDLFQLQLHTLALPLAHRCIELKPTEATYLSNRAQLYQSLHQLSDALEDYTKALKISPNCAPYHNSRGLVLYNLGRLSEAIEEHSTAISLQPDDYVFWNNRGLSYYKLGSYQEALDNFSESLRKHPTNSVGLYNRGRVLCDMGRLTEAESDFKKSLELCDGNDLAGYYRCGLVLERQDKSAEALTLFNSAMEKQLKPKDAEDWHALGQILQRLARHEESIEAFNSALKLQPYNPEYLEARAKSMNAVGRIGQALEDKERSLELRLSAQQVGANALLKRSLT